MSANAVHTSMTVDTVSGRRVLCSLLGRSANRIFLSDPKRLVQSYFPYLFYSSSSYLSSKLVLFGPIRSLRFNLIRAISACKITAAIAVAYCSFAKFLRRPLLQTFHSLRLPSLILSFVTQYCPALSGLKHYQERNGTRNFQGASSLIVQKREISQRHSS